MLLLADAPLTLREFVTHEEIPLASIFREVLDFLAGRSDAVIFGAHAVNAYCEPERMTQDVDLLSTNGAALAEQLRARLAEQLRIAARVREVVPGQGFRIYQERKPSNRHLVKLRQVDVLPSSQPFGEVRVLAPPELIAMKVVSLVRRAGRPKAGTDLVDVQRLLLTFPDLKSEEDIVIDRLRDLSAPGEVLTRWRGDRPRRRSSRTRTRGTDDAAQQGFAGGSRTRRRSRRRSVTRTRGYSTRSSRRASTARSSGPRVKPPASSRVRRRVRSRKPPITC